MLSSLYSSWACLNGQGGWAIKTKDIFSGTAVREIIESENEKSPWTLWKSTVSDGESVSEPHRCHLLLSTYFSPHGFPPFSVSSHFHQPFFPRSPLHPCSFVLVSFFCLTPCLSLCLSFCLCFFCWIPFLCLPGRWQVSRSRRGFWVEWRPTGWRVILWNWHSLWHLVREFSLL